MLIDTSDEVCLGLFNNFARVLASSAVRDVKERGLSKGSTSRRKFRVGVHELLVVNTPHAVLVHPLCEPEKRGPWLGVSGIDFNQVQKLLMKAKEERAQVLDLENFGGWFFQRVVNTFDNVKDLRLVVAYDRGLDAEHPLDAIQAAFHRPARSPLRKDGLLHVDDRHWLFS